MKNDLACIIGDTMVEWVDCGEGICGDYDENNPNDIPLLRFDVSVWKGSWQAVDDGSYCTRVPVYTDDKRLMELLYYLCKQFAEVLNNDNECSIKKLGEALSWIEA